MISIKKIMSVIAIAFAVMTIAGSGAYVSSYAQNGGAKPPAKPGITAPVDPCTGNEALAGCSTTGFFGPLFNSVGAGGVTGVSSLIQQIGGFLVTIIAAVSVIFLILGAYSMVSDSGDGKGFATGKARITNAIIGLVVALLAFAITSVIIRIVK